MTETPQPYKVPAPEEINDLLEGDYTKDEAAPEKVMEVGDRAESSSTLEENPWQITEPYKIPQTPLDFTAGLLNSLRWGEVTKERAVELFAQELNAYDPSFDAQFQSAGTSIHAEQLRPGTEKGVTAETDNFIQVMISKDWLPGFIYIDLYDDGWEVHQHPDPLDEDISKPGWNEDKNEELRDLLRLKDELACTLRSIQTYAWQIENAAQAMRDGGLSGWEHRGVQLLVKFLAAQILDLVRRHLRVKLEVVRRDVEF